MKLSDIVQKATLEMEAIGFNKAKADVEGYSGAVRGATKDGELFTRQESLNEKALTRTASKLEAMTRANDSLSSSGAKVARMEALIAAERGKGATITNENLRALDNLRSQHQAVQEAIKGNVVNLADYAQAQHKQLGVNRLQRFELINLSRQFQDVGVSLASGQNPMLVAIQQGSQIADVFASSKGGAGAALKEFGGIALRFAVHPLTLLATTLGVAGLAAFQFAEQQNALARSLNGVGRAAGVSRDRLREIGEAGARQGGFGAGQGVALAGQFAGAGIAGSNIGSLIADTQKFAHAFGLDMDKAGDEIAQIVSESGLGAFEKRFGAASFATKETVRSLEASGRFIDAQTEKTRLFDEEVKKARDTSSELSKLWEKIVQFATTPIIPIGKAALGAKVSLEEQLRAAQSPGSLSAYERRLGINQDQSEITRLERERDAPARAARELQLNKQSQRAGSIIDDLFPDSGKLRKLKEDLDVVRPLTESAEGLAKLGDRADEARTTVERLTFGVAHFQTAAEKMREDSALAVLEIQARTFAEREAVAMEKARVTTLRETNDVTRAAIASESERAKLLAESARKVDDIARSSKDQLELAKLSPFERGLKEIEFKFRDLRETLLPTNAAAPMAAEFNTAGNAAKTLADALTGAASQIDRRSALPSFASGKASGGDPRGMSGFIQSEALRLGIDPRTALRVARSEGLGTFLGDQGTSGGAFQLHKGGRVRGGNAVGGLGDDFQRRTGLDPLDPANERQGITFALQTARRLGWRPFHGARKAGIGDFEGIGGGGAANDNDGLRSPIGKTLARSQEDEKQAFLYQQIDGRIKAVNLSLESSSRLLEVEKDTLFADTKTREGAIEAQKLLNQFIEQGIKPTDELKNKILEYGKAAGESARQAEEAEKARRKTVGKLDFARDAFGGTLGDVASAASKGENIGKTFSQALQQVQDSAIRMVADDLTTTLLGERGGTGLGLLGDLFGFGGGKDMTITANVVNVNGGEGGGGLLKQGIGLFGKIAGFFGGSPFPTGNYNQKFAAGGFVRAPSFAEGGGIPIIAHPGELILNQAQQGNVAASIQAAFAFGSNGQSSASSNDNRGGGGGGGVPQITFNNFAPGVTVTPERMTDGEIVFAIRAGIAENNKQMPSILADSSRRRA